MSNLICSGTITTNAIFGVFMEVFEQSRERAYLPLDLPDVPGKTWGAARRSISDPVAEAVKSFTPRVSSVFATARGGGKTETVLEAMRYDPNAQYLR